MFSIKTNGEGVMGLGVNQDWGLMGVSYVCFIYFPLKRPSMGHAYPYIYISTSRIECGHRGRVWSGLWIGNYHNICEAAISSNDDHND